MLKEAASSSKPPSGYFIVSKTFDNPVWMVLMFC